jgi:hypothetical protein
MVERCFGEITKERRQAWERHHELFRTAQRRPKALRPDRVGI